MIFIGFVLAFLTIMPFAASAETCAGAGGYSLSCCSDLSSSANSGQTCAVPANDEYTFTLNRFGFERSDGTITWVGSQTSFNAASVSVGAAMGAFVSGSTLPVGTYVAVRPELVLTFTVGASGTDTSDGIECTSGGAQTANLSTTMSNLGQGLPACSASPNATCETSDGYIRMRDTSLGNFTITSSSSPTLTFKFDVGSGAMFTLSSGACTYSQMGPMDVGMTLAN